MKKNSEVNNREQNYRSISPREGQSVDEDLIPDAKRTEVYFGEMFKPKTHSDWAVVIIFWVNIWILTVFAVVNAATFDPVWLPIACYLWVLLIESGLLAISKYYNSNGTYIRVWFIIPLVMVAIFYILALITLIVGASIESNEDIKNAIIGAIVVLHFMLVPGIVIFFTIYIPYKRAPDTDALKSVRLIILIMIATVLLIVAGIVFISVFGLFASGSG